MSSKAPLNILIVAGPTAGGKSAKAIELAHKHDGVIINCDSMQIYNALPILTAQPSEDDKQKAPHKLYGTLEPNEHCSAGIWRTLAFKEIESAAAQNKTPIICGGNGMYIKVLMEGLSPIPETPPDIRANVNKKFDELGAEKFYEELKKRDPESAARFHPQHSARTIRAYEVFEATGRKLSEWQKETKDAPPDNWNFDIHLVLPKREELYRRCDARFAWMLEHGALEEVKEFSKRTDIKPDALINKALGYAPLRAYLNGGISKEKATELAQTETRQYAKRQTTWFKNQLNQ